MGLGAEWLVVAFACTEEIEARENLACRDLLRGWPSGGRAVPPLPFEQREAIDLPFASQDGIKPMWEDPRNKWGGRWLVNLSKQRRHIELDHLWLETVSRGLGGEGPHRKGQSWYGIVMAVVSRMAGAVLVPQLEVSSSPFLAPATVSHWREL